MSSKSLIVGVDPGTTVGYAILDLDGKLLKLGSKRNMGIDDLIAQIASVGTVALVATDKKEVPGFVNKVAIVLGARVFCPEEDLSVERKRELANGNSDNDHERDSLAAALYAYNHFQNKLRRVEKQVEGMLEETKGRVLKGEKVSDIFAAGEEKVSQRELDLKSQLTSLRKENKALQAAARPASGSDMALRKAYESECEAVCSILRGLKDGSVSFIKEVPSIYFRDLESIGIGRGDVIMPERAGYDDKGIRLLEMKKVSTIITREKAETLISLRRPEGVKILRFRSFAFIRGDELKENKEELNGKGIESLIGDYRSSRG